MATPARHGERGQYAETPDEIPGRGWLDILKRVARQVQSDRIAMVAASVAFYATFAVFPALATLASLYGLFFNVEDVRGQIQALDAVLSPEAADVLSRLLSEIVETQHVSLGAGVAGGLFLTLASSSRGVKALMQALDIAYHEEERRGFFRRNAVAILLALAGMLLAALELALIAWLPMLISRLELGLAGKAVITAVHLTLLGALMFVGLALVYRYGPSRRAPRWAWVSPGAVAATALWLLACGIFSLFLRHFGDFNKLYGSMALAVVLMLWMLVTAYAVLLGAEINAEAERQTHKDTTEGGGATPRGQRGAYVADTVAS